MTTGFCSHCAQPGQVSRYRLPGVGLRFLLPACAERLAAMGLIVELVTDVDPRARDRGERVA